MKKIFLPLLLIVFAIAFARAQGGKVVTGVVTDSMKVTQPGSSVKYISDLGDSSTVSTDMDGKFSFQNVKGTKISLYVSSIGFVPTLKHFELTPNPTNVLPPIILKTKSNELNVVTIVGVNPVKFMEDTVEYKVAAYKVRDNAPIEDVLKKVPGIDVDANGNVSAGGQTVTKVRINGKDFMGGDVLSATKNLPADILESIQVIDDYGDQANLTGVKTGQPTKILNFTVRADKNYGYSASVTAGDGEDALPSAPGVTDNNRYLGLVNAYDFKGDRQITVLGSINNTNVNTFNFTGSTGGGGGGGGGFGGGGGGGGAGRGNAVRGGGAGSTGLATVANGITDAHSIGFNYRDNWSKTVTAYGSYSFADNSTLTNQTNLQNNVSTTSPSSSNDISSEHDNPINHRFTFNIEWKPDTINYLKLTPTYSYASTNTTDYDIVTASRSNVVNSAYTSNSIENSKTPTVGIIALYNHRLPHRNNFSISVTANTSQGYSFDNPTYKYTVGSPTAPAYQSIYTNNTTTSVGAALSYLLPIGKVTYLEFNYSPNYTYTLNNKDADTLSLANTLNHTPYLSNDYKSTYLTNKAGINYRVVETKYNYTLGIGVQPSTLNGTSYTTGLVTKLNEFNIIPTARYIYNFSRNSFFAANYNGSSSQPSYTQLQPVIDYSNALYPVQGNPDLKPQFTNNFSVRYNQFGLASGNIFFINGSFAQTSNEVVSDVITYPAKFSAAALARGANTKLVNTLLTQYLNTDGYYTGQGMFTYSHPWEERRYTIIFQGTASYTNNIGYTQSVDSNNVTSPLVKNIAKTLAVSPTTRFRVDITDVIDAQALVNYSVTRVSNSVTTSAANTNIRALTFGLTGKQYILKDWTFSYDYTKLINYGYSVARNQS